jgi:CBS domain-containing protein
MRKCLVIEDAPSGFRGPAETAAEMMTPQPFSVPAEMPVGDTAAFLSEFGISAAVVADEEDNLLGVVSRTDLVGQAREGAVVREVMTQVVFAVEPETPAGIVVDAMLALKVHRLFVVDGEGRAVGVISALDVLRHLHA